LPHLQALHEKYGQDDVVVLLVDVRNLKDQTKEMADNASLSMPVLLDEEKISREKYNVRATPTTVIIDRSGKAVFRHVGYGEGEEKMLEREIELLLKRAPA
jgi:thiol-disulfide isomerase/thioredoxin